MSYAAEPQGMPVHEKIVWTALLLGVSGFGFLALDAHHAARGGQIAPLPLETALDAYVPFVPGFVYAYLLYFLWILLPLPILRTRRTFFSALGAFALVQVLAQAVFMLWPSHMQRPNVLGTGAAPELLRLLYGVDPGWNVFPSLHVAHSWLVSLLYFHYDRRRAPLVAAGTALIALSTVLIKQHYVVDLPAGALLAWVAFWLSERIRSFHDALHAPRAPSRNGALLAPHNVR